MLVVYAMALDLQDRPGHVELALDALKRTLPQKAFEFFEEDDLAKGLLTILRVSRFCSV